MAKKPQAGANVLTDLKQKSELYAVTATTLSNLLLQVVAFFDQMPGKVEMSVDEGFFQLSLERMGKDWTLFISEMDPQTNEWDHSRVTMASLRLKAQAAQMLPTLYQRVIDYFDTSQEMLVNGINSLQMLPFIDIAAAQQCDSFSYDDDFGQGQPSQEGGFPDDEIPF